MRRKVIAFDLDGTLAVTKSPIDTRMAALLLSLLDRCEVCVISGGAFQQFELQLIDRLDASVQQRSHLHVMPTCGTRYLRFDATSSTWVLQYAEDLDPRLRVEVAEALTAAAQELGFWESNPAGDIIEDRGSQVTFSALGQDATSDRKHAWDPDGSKKRALRVAVSQRLPNLEVRIGGTTSIDVTDKGIDKAFGMRKLMQALHLDTTDVLFIGDQLGEGGNDAPVKSIGIDCIGVRDWQDTALVVEAIVGVTMPR